MQIFKCDCGPGCDYLYRLETEGHKKIRRYWGIGQFWCPWDKTELEGEDSDRISFPEWGEL